MVQTSDNLMEFSLISAYTLAQWSSVCDVEHPTPKSVHIPVNFSVSCSVPHIALTFSYKFQMF